VQSESITQLPESLISLNTFPNHTGMYYEFREHIKLTNTDWNLITFVDLSNFNSKFQLLRSTYKATAEVCNELQYKVNVTEFWYPCKQFDQSVNTYLFEIEANLDNIWTTIGQDTSVEGRVRRSFGTSLTKMAKVLFSSKSFLDVTSILQGISDLSMARQSTSDLVENQTRLFQTTMSEISKSISNISDHQQKLKENFQLLQTQANKNSMTINTLMVKTTLLEQSIILESLLNQYAYETQNLISIINSAIHGKIHSTVLPPIKLIKELRAIQLTLPAGTQLPVEPKIQNVPEFLSISSISILQKDFLLIFALHFPIITVNSYDMYHPIPLPFYMKDDNAVIIEPEVDYISFSDDSEFYFTLTQQQSDSCTRLTSYTICKGNEPIQRRASSKICEVEILKNPQFLPISCKSKYIKLDVSIWNRLFKTDSWIYCTRSEFVTLNCKNPQKSFQFNIKGIGRLSISPSCTLHTTMAIMSPILNTFINHTLDLVPENPLFNISNIKELDIEDINPQTLSHFGLYKNLRQAIRESTMERKPNNKITENFLIVPMEYHIVIEYLCILIVVIVIAFLFVKSKKQKIYVYKPEIAETEC